MGDQVVDVAVHGGGDTAAAVFDAMISDAVLGEVIGADLFAAITTTDQATAFG